MAILLHNFSKSICSYLSTDSCQYVVWIAIYYEKTKRTFLKKLLWVAANSNNAIRPDTKQKLYLFQKFCIRVTNSMRFIKILDCCRKQKKTTDLSVAAHSCNSDRSGEKPYCTFIICIRFQKVNSFFENVLFLLKKIVSAPIYLVEQIIKCSC